MLDLIDQAMAWIADPAAQAAAILVFTFVLALVIQWVVHKVVHAAVKRTETRLDDDVYAALRWPIFLTVVLFGLHYASITVMPEWIANWTSRFLKTAAVLLWLLITFRLSELIFRDLVVNRRDSRWLQPRAVPLYDMTAKFSALGLAIYALMLTWDLNLTAWMASAGIAGIAIGFAAKDTLANLIAGLVIMADAPYKVGDWVVLEDGLRGEIRHMGMRSTRILTRDDVEITVPNALIGSHKIINEDGGHQRHQRVCVPVSVAYGSDIDLVRKALLECPANVDLVEKHPNPDVRFREFGDSGLLFELLVWTVNARQRGAMIDQLNCAIYKTFAKHGIEIPFHQHDIYIKQLPELKTGS
jgi:small-conductance mechanosensitive channel